MFSLKRKRSPASSRAGQQPATGSKLDTSIRPHLPICVGRRITTRPLLPSRRRTAASGVLEVSRDGKEMAVVLSAGNAGSRDTTGFWASKWYLTRTSSTGFPAEPHILDQSFFVHRRGWPSERGGVCFSYPIPSHLFSPSAASVGISRVRNTTPLHTIFLFWACQDKVS